ncbi:MAG: hypothetical protein GFGODING_00966 [Flavobacteriales bacterium]|nr:hypothetical protein [Flavobacteriales bacterium]
MVLPHMKNILAFTALLSAIAAGAQYNCGDYHKFNCERSTDVRFSLNGQSKSASVQVGRPTELNIIVYGGQDYRISFCYDEKIIGDHVVARLVEKVRVPREQDVEVVETEEVRDANGQPTGEHKEVRRMVRKTVFEDDRKVLWDNTEHELAQAVEFSAATTKRLVVEVMAPGATEQKGRAKGLDIGCVGILIEHMPTPNVGF